MPTASARPASGASPETEAVLASTLSGRFEAAKADASYGHDGFGPAHFPFPPNDSSGLIRDRNAERYYQEPVTADRWQVLKDRLDGEPKMSTTGKMTHTSTISDRDDSYDNTSQSIDARDNDVDDGWGFGVGMQTLQQRIAATTAQGIMPSQDESHSDQIGITGLERDRRLDENSTYAYGNKEAIPIDETFNDPLKPMRERFDMMKASDAPSASFLADYAGISAAVDADSMQYSRDGALDSAAPLAGSSHHSETNEASDLTRAGSVTRTNAIAMLRRAASQREVRNRSPGPQLALQDTMQTSLASGSPWPGRAHAASPLTALELTEARYITTPGGASLPLYESRTESPSGSRGGEHSALNNGFLGSSLSRSASRLGGGGNKSPLPSLEQLRARILQERATAGLARSASTSAASAAARQYAMEKLLGKSFREGAVSPVSDTAEEQEEENKRLSVVKQERPLLRRSRTIGGLSASAEAQRKAAFVEALDQSMPNEGKGPRRGSRRFAHAPSGQTSDAKDGGLERGHNEVGQEQQGESSSLHRKVSQRQVARTELLRKLSARRGAASPASANSHHSPLINTGEDTDRSKGQQAGTGISSITPVPVKFIASGSEPDSRVHLSTPRRNGPALERSTNTTFLGIPQLGKHTFSPSSRSSAGFQHDVERKRASEVARLNNEEAFEYERLLEMGYSTDDAWDRIASARKSIIGESDSNDIPTNHKTFHDAGETSNPAQTDAVFVTPAHSTHESSFDERARKIDFLNSNGIGRGGSDPGAARQQGSSLNSESSASSIRSRPSGSLHGHQPPYHKEDWLAKHPSEASIPLGLDAIVYPGDEVTGNPGKAGNGLVVPSNANFAQSSPYPESILASPTTSTINAKYDSGLKSGYNEADESSHITPSRNAPEFAAFSARIQALLSPGFLAEVGNPLDYAHSPIRSVMRHSRQSLEAGAADVGGGETTDITSFSGHADPDAKYAEEHLQISDHKDDELGRFPRQTERSVRDAAVLQSSAAQVQAAAKDFARHHDMTPSSSGGDFFLNSASILADPAQRREGSPLILSTVPLEQSPSPSAFSPVNDTTAPALPPKESSTRIGGAYDSNGAVPSSLGGPDLSLYATNSKLAPFPALLSNKRNGFSENEENGGDKPPMPTRRRPDAQSGSSRDHAVARSGSGSGKETFFSSLRRKASRSGGKGALGSKTASPVLDQTVSRPMSPTQKLHSLLTRRPSAKEGTKAGIPPVGSLHWRSVSGSKIRPSQPVPLGDIFHITPPDTALRPLAEHQSHARNISVSSTGTSQQADGSSALLDAGQANSPTKRKLPVAGLAPSAAEAFNRYSRVLTSSTHPDAVEPAGIPGLSSEQVNKPPRDYIMSSPILQIVNASAIKDRFAFLFSDLIVIAKPLHSPSGEEEITSPEDLPNLSWTFAVKSIIEIDSLRMTVPKSEQRHTRRQTPMLVGFVGDFKLDPDKALRQIIEHSGLPHTPATIAQFLQQTPELDRETLSRYLFARADGCALIRNYVQIERFAGVSIESALRALLIELRFPKEREALQDLLTAFARRWTEINRSLIKENFTAQLAVDLVLAIVCLNDALHSGAGKAPGYFSSANARLSGTDFVASFRTIDAQCVLSDRTLTRIYGSVRSDPLQQAMDAVESENARVVSIAAPGVPPRVTYGVVSDPICITIARPDPDFAIRLYGEGLSFQPQILTFEKSARQEFRIMSKDLGQHTLVFVRAGRNARMYQSPLGGLDENQYPLPRFATVTVQRAFMKHCLTLALPNDVRFLFSVASEEQQQQWVKTVGELTELRQAAVKSGRPWSTGGPHALSVHVLREALIEPDETPPVDKGLQRNGSAMTSSSDWSSSRPDATSLSRNLSGTRAGGKARDRIFAQRQGSISKHYFSHSRPGHGERDLVDPEQLLEEFPDHMDGGPHTAAGRALTGEELLLTVKQNSLLPLVIDYAQRTIAP